MENKTLCPLRLLFAQTLFIHAVLLPLSILTSNARVIIRTSTIKLLFILLLGNSLSAAILVQRDSSEGLVPCQVNESIWVFSSKYPLQHERVWIAYFIKEIHHAHKISGQMTQFSSVVTWAFKWCPNSESCPQFQHCKWFLQLHSKFLFI